MAYLFWVCPFCTPCTICRFGTSLGRPLSHISTKLVPLYLLDCKLLLLILLLLLLLLSSLLLLLELAIANVSVA